MLLSERSLADYTRLSEALIDDINTDKRVALKSLSREAYMKFGVDPNTGNDVAEERERASCPA